MFIYILKLILTIIFLLITLISHAIQLEPIDKDFTLQLLGSGGPISDNKRSSSATLIWWKGKSRILIDAGSGSFLRFGQSGAKMEDLDFLGISHLHTDHVTDLPALLKNGYFFNRSRVLKISGPTRRNSFPSLTEYMDALFNSKKGAYAYLNGIYSGTEGLFPVAIQNVNADSKARTKVYEKDGLTIWAKSIPHGDVPCLAYRIESKKGVIVISADQNGSDDTFIDFAKGADILVMPMAINEGADNISSFLHAKPSVVEKIAEAVSPKILILNHWMGKGLAWKNESLKSIRKSYNAPIFVGRDLASFPINAVKEENNEK